MPSGEFARIVRDLQLLSESIKIECNKDGITFSCEGDIGNGSVTIKPTAGYEGKEETATTIDLTEPVTLTFSTKYLVNFTKATPLAASVKLSMSEEIPLLVEYPLNASGSHLRFFRKSSFTYRRRALKSCIADMYSSQWRQSSATTNKSYRTSYFYTDYTLQSAICICHSSHAVHVAPVKSIVSASLCIDFRSSF